MQSDWEKAPDWANYRAKDKDGTWHWFEEEPQITLPNTINHWDQWLTYGKMQEIELKDTTWWTRTLEKRPQ